MFSICKRFEFSAAHALTHLPDDHKCHNLHGHNYTVELVYQSEDLNKDGFVVDFAKLDFAKEYIDKNLDHKNLNDVLSFYTTSENLAKHLFHQFASNIAMVNIAILDCVRVSETPKTWAEYRSRPCY